VNLSGNFKQIEKHRSLRINWLRKAILCFSLIAFTAPAFSLLSLGFPAKGAAGFEQERRDSQASTMGQNASSLPRYVVITGNSNDIIMSGRKEDLQHAQELRETIKGDFIWFRRGEKSYIITDPAFIARARALFAPEKELERKQEELSRQEAALSSQPAAHSKQGDNGAAKLPDPALELEQVRARMKELESSGASQSQLAALQMRTVQSWSIKSPSHRLKRRSGIRLPYNKMPGLRGNQGEIARQQGELARRQSDSAQQASLELRDMLEEAVAKGIARPE
jgi:hypothetical protein